MPPQHPKVTFTENGAIHDGRVYVKINGVYYRLITPPAVIFALDNARVHGKRVHIHYGETDPTAPDLGRDWMDEHGVDGRVSNSMGPLKVPLLVEGNKPGGDVISDEKIVRLKVNGREVYRHPNYRPYVLAVRATRPGEVCHDHLVKDPFAVDVDGVPHAYFKSELAAKRWASKMQ